MSTLTKENLKVYNLLPSYYSEEQKQEATLLLLELAEIYVAMEEQK